MAVATKCNQSQVKVKGVAAILTQKVCFKLALVEANTLFMASSVCCAIVFHSFSSRSKSTAADARKSVTRPFAQSVKYKEITHLPKPSTLKIFEAWAYCGLLNIH